MGRRRVGSPSVVEHFGREGAPSGSGNEDLTVGLRRDDSGPTITQTQVASCRHDSSRSL